MIAPLASAQFSPLQPAFGNVSMPGPAVLPTRPVANSRSLAPGLPGADQFLLSPEAFQAQPDMANFLSAFTQAWGGNPAQQETPAAEQGANSVEALQAQAAQLKEQIAQAQASGDMASLNQLLPQLEALLAQLAQLLGGQQMDGGASGAEGGAPSGMGGGDFGGGMAPTSSGGGGGGGGGMAPASSGGGGGSVGSSGGSDSAAPSEASGSDDSGPISTVPPELAADDKKLAEAIEAQLKGTPLANQGLGAHFVAAGRENKVDPLALVAISRHETNHGKLGVGVSKHMGVGAFDSSPNTPRKWDGAQQQIYSGAKTFANLRKKGGSNEKAPLAQQLSAVNKAGWATDQGWHRKVGSHYNEVSKTVSKAAESAARSTPKSTPKPSASKGSEQAAA